MTAELYIFFFTVLGIYVTTSVWHRTAEERGLQELMRAERDVGDDRRNAAASGTARE